MNAVKNFFWITTGILVLLILAALSTSMNYADGLVGFMAQGWPADAAKRIVANRSQALWHASFMALAAAAVFALFTFQKLAGAVRYKTAIAAALVLLVAGDALLLARHYIQPMPSGYVQANALTDYLKKNLGTGRVALLTQESIYNVWVGFLLPYNQIDTFNFAQMPRMPEDYKNFLSAGSKNPFRMWRFSSVKYLLGPAAFEKQLPPGQVQKVFAYDLAPAEQDGFRLVANPNGAHAVFELLDSVPRYTLLTGFQTAADDQALARLGGTGPLLNGTPAGTVETVQSRPGYVSLKTQSGEPAMLRVAERWDADWKAKVDGQPAPIRRIDYLCMGVELPAGDHEVTLCYSPSRFFFYMQCAGCLILLSALTATIPRQRIRNQSLTTPA
ncbi:MAG: YfhO family protein [Pontiellaceae bacterium]|nr:YfhO family protein [Pontiellaceae bacterium]